MSAETLPVETRPTFLDLARAEAARADAAEQDLRARFAEELVGLERARVLANRRAALLGALAAGIDGAADDAAAHAAGERVLEEELGLRRAEAAHAEHLDAFRPVSDAIDTLLNCEDEAMPQSVLEALAAFEAEFRLRTGSEFLSLYDVYRPETPVVDF